MLCSWQIIEQYHVKWLTHTMPIKTAAQVNHLLLHVHNITAILQVSQFTAFHTKKHLNPNTSYCTLWGLAQYTCSRYW